MKGSKLSQAKKDTLIESASRVYNAYLALELAKTREIITGDDGKKITLFQWLETLPHHSSRAMLTKRINIAGNTVDITLKKETNNRIEIAFDTSNLEPEASKKKSRKKAKNNKTVKQKKAYKTETDVLRLFGTQKFMLDIERGVPAVVGSSDATPVLHLGVSLQGKMNEELLIGGAGKLDLYSTHLTTLYNIINHLQKGKKSLDNILIVLATGSGKTFIQALWFLVLQISEINLVQSVPVNLIGQFKKDLKRLLPDDMVDKLVEISKPDDNLPADGPMIIGHELLGSKLKELLDLDPSSTQFTFDELHLLAEQEARKLRLEVLKEKFLTTLLTATPDKPTYRQTGKPVATMSNKQKQESGQGVLSRVVKVRAKSLFDKLKALHRAGFKHRVVAKLAGSIEAETISAAITGLEHLEQDVFFIEAAQFNSIDWRHGNGLLAEPIVHSYHQGRWELRWKLQVPMARRMLVICDDVEECINISNHLNHDLVEGLGGYTVKYGLLSFLNPIHLDELKDKTIFIGQSIDGFHYIIKNSGGHILNEIIPTGNLHGESIKAKNMLFDLAEKGESAEKIIPLLRKIDPNLDYKLLQNFGIYKNKNIYQREDVFELVSEKAGNLDYIIGAEYHVNEISNRDVRIKKGGGDFILAALPQQIEYNILHNMINYFLKGLLGFDDIALDRARFNDLGALVKMVKSVVASHRQTISTDYFFKLLAYDVKTNPKGIDSDGAIEVARILYKMYCQVFMVGTEKLVYDFVDNWSLDQGLRDELFTDSSLHGLFKSFAAKHRTLFVMNGRRTDDVSIDDGRVFSHFSQDVYQIFEDGKLSSRAKNRERPSRELLSPFATEYQFSPEYTGQEECIADNYAKLGFIGAYVGDRKREGYNDPSLHTVMALSNRDPDKKLQAFGRNRGLNPLASPVYYDVDMPGHREYLDLDKVNKKTDYLPQLFSGKKKYIEDFQRQFADEIVREINLAIMENMDSSGNLNDELFRTFVLRLIIKKFKDFNNKNYHDIELTREHFVEVLGMISEKLNSQVGHIQHPYRTSGLVKFAKFVAERIERFRSNKKGKLRALSEAIIPSFNSGNDMAYRDILKYTDYHRINRLLSAVAAMERDASKQETAMRNNMGSMLKGDLYDTLHRHMMSFFLPAIAKFFKDEEGFLELAHRHPSWVETFFLNFDAMEELSGLDVFAQYETSRDIILGFVKSVPFFRMLTPSDMVDDLGVMRNELEQRLDKRKSQLEREGVEKVVLHLLGQAELDQFKYFSDEMNKKAEEEKQRGCVKMLVSDDFRDAVNLAFTKKDAASIHEFLGEDVKNIEAVAVKMLKILEGDEDAEEILDVFVKSINEHLAEHVQLVTKRVDFFDRELNKIFKDVKPDENLNSILKVCDREKLQQYIKQELLPAVSFDFIKQVLDQIIGYFKKSDTCLTLLGHVVPQKNPEELRKEILGLYACLSGGHLDAVYERYADVSHEYLQLDNFKYLVEVIFKVLDEIRQCHMFFMGVDSKGRKNSYNNTFSQDGFKIVKKLSWDLQDIVDDVDENVWQYAQLADTASGLSPLSDVTAHHQRNLARHLNNTKCFLVDPFLNTLGAGKAPKWRGTSASDQRFFDFQAATGFAQELLKTRAMTREDVLSSAGKAGKKDALVDLREKLKTPKTMGNMLDEDLARKSLESVDARLRSHRFKIGLFGGKKIILNGKKRKVSTNAFKILGLIAKAKTSQVSYRVALEETNTRLQTLKNEKSHRFFPKRRHHTTSDLFAELGEVVEGACFKKSG